MAFPASLHTLSDEEEQSPRDLDSLKQVKRGDDIDNHHNGTPLKFVPLRHVYSSTAPCVTGSSALPVSKKVRARRVTALVDHNKHRQPHQQQLQQNSLFSPPSPPSPPTPSGAAMFFSRRPKGFSKPSFFDTMIEKFDPLWKKRALSAVKPEPVDGEEDGLGGSISRRYKRRRIGDEEIVRFGVNLSRARRLREPKLREPLSQCNTNGNACLDLKKRRKRNSSVDIKQEDDLRVRKWVRLAMDGVSPITFVGLQCQVYWPLDDDWYKGSVIAYDSESKQHNIKYEDDDEEDLVLSREKIKFYLSREEMLRLNLNLSDKNLDDDQLDYSELLVLAASLDESQELEPGDIIWAKLTGHAMWPAVIVDESRVGDRKGMNKNSSSRSVPVQFFGTHDFARIQGKHIVSFLRGLLCSFHLKCKSPRFHRSLREAKNYLNEQKLPKDMLHLQCASVSDDSECHSDEDDQSICARKGWTRYDARGRSLQALSTTPLTIGDLQIISFGEIVRDSVYFHDERTAWPLGYTALRKFSSIRDPSVTVLYKMEVLRDSESKIRPLFRVTADGEQFKGGSPSACWSKIFKRMGKTLNDVFNSDGGAEMTNESGAEMYGFTNPEVLKLIKNLSNSKVSPEPAADKLSQRYQSMPIGYRPVRIDWKDLDRCSVCHMDEEYETNLFLQCDKCRIMVHARCYGEEFVDGKLWLCNLCRPGAPESTPPCCLCPVIGGAMKPTTDGRWAHLACAIWIPETCLNDIKRMEPIDGFNRINKDRWKLLCSICGVPYGACIQCSNSNCRVSYHPLCARAAGLCVELEDEDRLHLIPVDEDEEDQCIRLLSFCKKHKQPSNEFLNLDVERVGHVASQCSSYSPPSNPSGCARSEPYDYFGRRGRKEPEALAAASFKRLFLENRPYLVGGYSLHESLVHVSSRDDVLVGSKISNSFFRDNTSILSVSEKYVCMKQTFRKQLAFGKSRIHGFGIFAKQPHKAGDMVVEYTGEIVRPPVADRREHFIYNSLVGAGTYMFRIDNDRVIDATRAGSIAHLINHSCEPNCYSRVITVNGDEHIIIFAKRDIRQWEELTYDYRFFSIDEQLPCYCGFPRCRGVVNDVEAEEQVAKLYAPRSELVEFKDYP